MKLDCEKNNGLISVVVPVYNISKYIGRCIKSILCQTYSNIEVLLVDDGSTDDSKKICEKYAKFDGRISVLCKSNGGLSDARNYGMKYVKGEYIMFIDGDDYIAPYCIETLYNILVDNEADISVGRMIRTSKNDDSSITNNCSIYIYDKCEALRQMFYSKDYSTAVPAKLIKKELLDGIEFPYGKFSEDLFTLYKVINRSEKLVYTNQIVYYYYHREGSITQSGFKEKQLEIVEAMEIIKNELPIYEYKLEKAYASQMLEGVMNIIFRKPTFCEMKRYNLWSLIKEYRKMVVFDKSATKRVRGYALLSYLGPIPTREIACLYLKIRN